MKKNWLQLITIAVYSVVLFSACTPQVSQENTSTIEYMDALGNEVVLESLPERIVVVGKQTPMIVDLVFLFPNVESKIAGIENRSQTTKNFISALFPSVETLINLEKGAGPEQIAALNPDLVILKTSMAEQLDAGLGELGIPRLYISLESIEEITKDINNLGIVLGDSERASELNVLYSERKTAISESISTSENKPKVLVMQVSEEDGTTVFKVPSASWLQTNMVEMANGMPVWKDAASGGGWLTVNIEQVAEWDPESIFVINYFGDSSETVAVLQNDTVWQELSAYSNNAIYGFPGDFISWDQPDSRWILGFEWLAAKINQDEFAEIELMDAVKSFYVDFYQIDDEVFVQTVESLIYGDL